MIRSITFHWWRWTAKCVQALIIIGTPFILINGQSLLRFDIPSLRLYVFGAPLWMEEFFTLLLGALFAAFLFILTTLLFGRVWCGWICPQTVLNDVTDLVTIKTKGKSIIKPILTYIIVVILSVLVSANIIWYFVTPYEFFNRLVTGSLGDTITGIWIVLSILLFANMAFVKRTFCASVCPYSKLQSIMFDRHTLVISFDQTRASECMNCKACVRACPVNIDIRKGLNPACINCAECIDACKRMTHKVKKETLIDYRFGIEGNLMMPVRLQVIIFAAATLISLGAFLYAAAVRQDIDMVVMQNNLFQPRLTDEGLSVNSYILSVSNRDSRDRTFTLKAGLVGIDFTVHPSTFVVKGGAHQRLQVYVSVPHNMGSEYIYLRLSEKDSAKDIQVKRVGFIKPEGLKK